MIAGWLKQRGKHFGSLKLVEHKELSNSHSVQRFPVTVGMELVLPLQQHIGDKPEVIVRVGDYVHKSQPLAKAEGKRSIPIHASTSGTIIAIEDRPIPHPSGLSDPCIILQADGLDTSGDCSLSAIPDYRQQGSNPLRQRIREAGIVGLGGAAFPSDIKLAAHQPIPIDTLVINGAECEPYITCDEMLMRDKADEILAGAQIMLHILEADRGSQNQNMRCLIGIEDNKAQAIRVMQQAISALADDRLVIIVVPTQYPAGGERQLIHVLTGKEVPSGGRPADIGVICHNVATSRAIYRAVVLGEPLISRYVTVTGGGVEQAGNIEVALGVKIGELLGVRANLNHILMGGPMMGIPLHSDHIPVTKATNCILVNTNPPTPATPLPCIRCGKCADHCPAGLLPQQLYWYAKARDFAKTKDYQLFDCIECGNCAYVCPSHIPLVDYYRFAKTEIRGQQQAKDKAELARERHDFHHERLERAKRERIERLAKHKKKAVAKNKKDAIQAALERAKARKALLAQGDQQPLPDSDRRSRSKHRNRQADAGPKPGNQEPGQ